MVDAGPVNQRRPGHRRQLDPQNCQHIEHHQELDALGAGAEMSQPQGGDGNQQVSGQKLRGAAEQRHPRRWEMRPDDLQNIVSDAVCDPLPAVAQGKTQSRARGRYHLPQPETDGGQSQGTPFGEKVFGVAPIPHNLEGGTVLHGRGADK